MKAEGGRRKGERKRQKDEGGRMKKQREPSFFHLTFLDFILHPSAFIPCFHPFSFILLPLLLIACAPVPIPTTTIPAPTTIPTAPAPPTPQPTSTDAPTATAAAIGTASPTAKPTALPTATLAPIAYDRNPRAILIEADVAGGLTIVPRDAHVPRFRLYADGLVVFAGERAALSTGLDAIVRVGHLSDAEIQNLLAYLSQIGFYDLKEYYEPRPKPTDMPTGQISVYLNKVKTVRVYAPGFQGTPPIFSDALARITQTIPADAQTFTPTDGFLQSIDAGAVGTFSPGYSFVEWSGLGVRLADATEGITVSGNAYDKIVALRANNPTAILFREGDRVYRLRFSPNLPRAVHLTDWLGAIVGAPREFDGRVFDIVGYFRGWNLLGEARGNPPVTRRDWVIADDSGAMYVAGATPPGLDSSARADAWNVVRLRAVVVYVRNGTSYLEVRRVDNLTPKATPTAASMPIANADAAIAFVKSKFGEVAKIQRTAAGLIGASSNIWVFERTDGWDLAFWEGWGDCPSGCINNRYHYFTVKKDGRATKVGEYARIYNADKNSFDTAGAPMWGVPAEPSVRYPRAPDDAQPTTVAGRAARHLAGWLHTPIEEIVFVRVEPAQAPPATVESCGSRWEIEDSGSPPPPGAPGQLIVFQVGKKKYGYHAVGAALLLCPISVP